MESAHKLPWEAPLFQVFFFFLEDHAANRNNSRGRAQDNFCLQTSFSNIKIRPKNVNYAQVFEVTRAPLTRARSPDKLSCKSENWVGDKGDTFKARRIHAKTPYTRLTTVNFLKGNQKPGFRTFHFLYQPSKPSIFPCFWRLSFFYCCDL